MKIGKISGIDIDLNWSFLFLLLIFGLFGGLYALIIIVLLFVCVLVHEFSHSITAIRNGIKVKMISLTIFGGVSVLDDTNIDPKLEFNISVVGPIMSLFLGGIFGIMVLFMNPGLLEHIVQLLFLLNIFLGVFNILPSFPMDGGKVLRSYLQRKHDAFDATMITAKVSKIVLVLVVVGTIAYVALVPGYNLSYGAFVILLTVVITFILYGGVVAEEQNAVLRKGTAGLKLKDVMIKRFALIDPSTRVDELYNVLKRTKESLIVTRINDGFGIINVSKAKKVQKQTYVRDLAMRIPSLSADSNIIDTIGRIQGTTTGIAVVVKGNKPVGIVTLNRLETFISLHMMDKGQRKGF